MHKSVLYMGRIFDFFDILSGPCWYAVAGPYCPVHAVVPFHNGKLQAECQGRKKKKEKERKRTAKSSYPNCHIFILSCCFV